VPKLVVGTSPLPAAIAKRLQRYIQTYLVANLETVRHRLGGVVDTNEHTFYGMLFDASLKGARGKANEPERWVVNLWSPRFAPDGKPHLVWRLGG
jgi:hypothetical protein